MSDRVAGALPLSYRVRLPGGDEHEIATTEHFWQAVDEAALWYLRLSPEKRRDTQQAVDEDASLPQQVGTAVAAVMCPRSIRDYAALILIDEGQIWESYYASSDEDEENEPTPRQIFDVTLRESIVRHLEEHWEDLEERAQGAQGASSPLP
jgi:hypothetical protein